MVTALVFGASSGVLHAVTGPDHVLSLGPVALREREGSWRIGLAWGVGHAFGTLLLAFPVLLLANLIHVPTLADWGDRLAGAVLLATAAWSWASLRKAARGEAIDGRSPAVVGLVHGLSGAGSLMLMLPILIASSTALSVSFLAAFSVASALAMAGLTWAISRLGARLESALVARVQRVLVAASAVLGLVWLFG